MKKKTKRKGAAAKIDVYKVDRSPDTVKKAKKMFKDIEHIKVPYSGVEMLKIVRGQMETVPTPEDNSLLGIIRRRWGRIRYGLKWIFT